MSISRRTAGIALIGCLALSGCAIEGLHQAPIAQYVHGVHLLQSRPAGENIPAGIRLIRRAAEKNLALAQDRLGLMYLYGSDVPANTARALKWIRRAAQRGAPAAALQLGNLYRAGVQVPHSSARAYYWYSIAAAPVVGNIHIRNSAQVHAYARRLCQQVGSSLSTAGRAQIDRRVAQWRPLPSVSYTGWVTVPAAHAR